MRIAYSCAGEGFGHAARMAALYPDLAERHEVSLFIPPAISSFIRTRLPGVHAEPIPCFTLSKRGNRILYGATAFAALRLARDLFSEVTRLARRLRRRRIDAVLSDFDPFLPLAARMAGIPIVQMNHPGIVLKHLDADPRSWAAALSALFLEGPSDARIIVSFYGGDVGPVLRKSLHCSRVQDDGFIAVNLKDEARSQVLPALDAVPGLRYKLYPSPGADFDEGLCSCSAVITGAGHQTLSEALCLGKPILALPQEGQYEQTLNARMLERTGRGTYCSVAELPSALPRFLSRISKYRELRIQPAFFCVTDSRLRLLDLLDASFDSLCRRSKGLPAFSGEKRIIAV